MSSDPIHEADWLKNARAVYLSGAPEKLSALKRAIEALHENPNSHYHEHRLRRLLHNLIGSGGSYGFPQVSQIARGMSECLHIRLDANLPVDDQTISALKSRLRELRAVFEDAKA